MLELNPAARLVMEILESNGFEAYVIGGYVRDSIMGRKSHDIDITTNALPEETKSCFSSFRTIDTGIKHGTVTVLIDSFPVEITTFRTDCGYTDNRHPESITFCGNLRDDVSRRDFTVNALAYSRKTGVVDYFNGIKDIENRVIRAIGNSVSRFNEDALRILRALRFASVLGFEIEEETAYAIHSCKELLKNISAERIAAEIRGILCGKNIKRIMMEYYDVFELVIPEISGMNGFNQHNFHHKYDVWEHTAVVVENTPPVDYLRLTALFHDCAKPDCFSLDERGVGHFYGHASISAEKAEKALRRLKFDNFTISKVTTLVRVHDTPIEETESYIKRRLSRLGYEMFKELILIQRADTSGLADEFLGRSEHFDVLDKLADEIISQKQCFSLSELDINGNDLIALGYEGREIGASLHLLLEAVIGGKVENKKESLIKFLKRRKQQ